jgi:hypothetical protein
MSVVTLVHASQEAQAKTCVISHLVQPVGMPARPMNSRPPYTAAEAQQDAQAANMSVAPAGACFRQRDALHDSRIHGNRPPM